MATLPRADDDSRWTKTGAGKFGAEKSKWDRVEEMDEFRLLLLAKKEFVIPTTVFFVVYYFALPVLVGYAPEFMSRKVLGPVNLAYLFALSQFFVAWGIAFAYVARSPQV